MSFEKIGELGLQVMSTLNSLTPQVTQQAKTTGLAVHRSLLIKYSVIFGIVDVSTVTI